MEFWCEDNMKDIEIMRAFFEKYATDKNYKKIFDACLPNMQNMELYDSAEAELYWYDRNETVSANDPEVIALAKKLAKKSETKALERMGIGKKDMALLTVMNMSTKHDSRLNMKVRKVINDIQGYDFTREKARSVVNNIDTSKELAIIKEKVKKIVG